MKNVGFVLTFQLTFHFQMSLCKYFYDSADNAAGVLVFLPTVMTSQLHEVTLNVTKQEHESHVKL